ncbi:TonB-dependent receptor plug domain-containing protein [Thiolapillus brandeum]|uniref:Iron complex outermembrane recepter protein n=1 Tax=Thiolapillus brandeum TaxID=1076588 RepID=A0A7U6GI89_9GAMM|nr:TonB-dependent receptor [Thiolapillus brandeum]BAO44105.1 iron complex outermembrane recepter protein [Thiolapillus brandeum]
MNNTQATTLTGYSSKAQLLVLLGSFLTGSVSFADEPIENFMDMPLADLLSMEVTSVSKKKQRLDETAAAIFVITQEDIRRSGVTSIPEALRLAPGLQVAHIDANKWAISSRGFNNQFANKLLVMIDGRTVYTPTFSGVYWDVQDTLLEDIDRIEVIRGPGAAVWGANAVNGVINIITRNAGQTEGGLVSLAAGNQEKALAGFRYGTGIGDQAAARIYVKYTDRDASWFPSMDGEGDDGWQSLRAGFRADGELSQRDLWTIQGDMYDTDQNQTVLEWKDPSLPENAIYAPFYAVPWVKDTVDSSGWNLLARWERNASTGSNTQLQIYLDHTDRSEMILDQTHDTLDIDFQQQLSPLSAHDLIWGLGYRRIRDDFDNTFLGAMNPERSTRDLYSAFVQDEIVLSPQQWRLILGSKFEHNDYTGFEVQPSIRMLWTPDSHNTFWGAVSRAVRTPSRLERGSRMVSIIVPPIPPYVPQPTVVHSLGNENFDSEKMLAYELGYRTHPRENISLDLALFYNDYDDLRSFEAVQPQDLLSDVTFDNKLSSNSYGLELVLDWWPLDWWRLQASYSYLRVSVSPDKNSVDPDSNNPLSEGSSPDHQLTVRSMMDLRDDLSLDLWASYVDELSRTAYSLKDSSVPAYTSFNARLAWTPARNIELSLVGQNLFDDHHPEFIGENFLTPTEVKRSWHIQMRWDF